ncbi:MAG: insulinase family protein [Alphaproteobacteria bacterium GM202ARS2]|nr:insulinase family protein [Alphaproteobacteria bacterium GM202ARS2]
MAFLLAISSPAPLHAELLTIEERGGLSGAYFYPDHGPDSVEVYLIIKSGGFDEGDGPDGIAHYLEHLVWLSTSAPDGQATAARHEGAWITPDITVYSLLGPPEDLDTFLATIANVFALPSVDEHFMIEERDVVLREYDFRYADDTSYPIARRLNRQLFGDAPMGGSVAGTPETIATMTPAMAFALHARTHVPTNAVLFITGKANIATVKRLVAKHLGDIPAGDPPPERAYASFHGRREISETSVKNAPYEQIIYAKRVKLNTLIPRDELSVKLSLLESILDSSREGSLAKPLHYDDFIARWYHIEFLAIEPGEILFIFKAAPDYGVVLSDLLNAFEDIVQAIADKGIPKATFDRIKKKRLSALHRGESRRERVIRLVQDQTAYDAAPIDPKTEDSRYEAITLDDVNRLMQAIAGPGDVAAALISPE